MNFDIMTLILSLVSIIISVFVFFKTRKLTIKYNNLVAGQQTIQIYQIISSARIRYEDLSIEYFSNEQNYILKSALDESMERLCNTYDLACLLYKSNKLDKEIFEKQYSNEIKSIIESKHFKDKYVQPHTKYQTTIEVYEEWFKPKK